MSSQKKSPASYTLRPVGIVHSVLRSRKKAPKQGGEGAPDAWIQINPQFSTALEGLVVGDQVILVTWFHKSNRSVLRVHPRGNLRNPIRGVFDTRSPDRPNPLGLHRVFIREIVGNRMKVGPLEAIDGTPVVDMKPVLSRTIDY